MTTLILFFLLGSPPPWQADAVRDAFEWWASYQSFNVAEVDGIDSISVEFAPLSPSRLGESYCTCWGHAENRIVLNSERVWTAAGVTAVVRHELGHLAMRLWGHRASGLMRQYYTPSNRPRLLTYADQWRLMELYGRVRPRPEGSAGRWTP